MKIDNVTIPTPVLTVSIMDLSKAERNSAGDMVIERVATKRKLDITYPLLSQKNTSLILNAISPVFFEVEFTDPQDGVIRTGTFYAGDRKAVALDIRNGEIRWKDITFSLIER